MGARRMISTPTAVEPDPPAVTSWECCERFVHSPITDEVCGRCGWLLDEHAEVGSG